MPVNMLTIVVPKATTPLVLVSTAAMLTRTGPPSAWTNPTGCQWRRFSDEPSSVAAE